MTVLGTKLIHDREKHPAAGPYACETAELRSLAASEEKSLYINWRLPYEVIAAVSHNRTQAHSN